MRLAPVLFLLLTPLAGCLGPGDAPDLAADEAVAASQGELKIDGFFARMGAEFMTRGAGGAWYRSAGTNLPRGDDVTGWIVEVHWEPGSAYWDTITLTLGTPGQGASPIEEGPTPAAEATGGSPLRATLAADAAPPGGIEWRIHEVASTDGAPLYQDFHVTVATFKSLAFDPSAAVPTEPLEADH